MKQQKAWWKSRTLWLAFGTGVVGAALSAVGEAAPGWVLGLLSMAQMVLRALTDQPLSLGETPGGPLEG